MEVELDVDSPAQSWRQTCSDWVACCRETWLCEEKRLFQDEPLDPQEWERHTSWQRHLPEPRVCLRVLHTLSPVEGWVLLVSTAVALYATYLQPKEGWPVAVSGDYLVVFSLTSFAVALLLVFRTNTAHNRWWEARRACGLWLNSVRNSQRMLLSWAPASEGHIVREFARWNAILTPAASAYLRRNECYWQHCKELLQPAELAWLKTCDNPPVKVLMIMSGLLSRSSLSPWERTTIEKQLSGFDIALGACERISRQAIPMAYTRHTSRFIIVYLTFLPFALWDSLHWLTLPTMLVLTFLLVGIENIGVQIENPFRVLPMHRFCIGCKAAALSMVRHNPDVQRTIDLGLMAAAGAQQQQQMQQQEIQKLREQNQAGGQGILSAAHRSAMQPLPPAMTRDGAPPMATF